jgi:hypothetical protein
MSDIYRIRWSRVTIIGRNFFDDSQQHMCMADRQFKFLWWTNWIPIGWWHYYEHQAQYDIDHDIEVRKPLPATKIITEEN